MSTACFLPQTPTDNGQRTTDNGQRTTDNGQRTTTITAFQWWAVYNQQWSIQYLCIVQWSIPYHNIFVFVFCILTNAKVSTLICKYNNNITWFKTFLQFSFNFTLNVAYFVFLSMLLTIITLWNQSYNFFLC